MIRSNLILNEVWQHYAHGALCVLNTTQAVIIGNSWKLRDRRKQAKAHLNIHKMVNHVQIGYIPICSDIRHSII